MKIKSTKLLFLYAITSITMASCVTSPGMPGFISAHVSEFDGTAQIKMEPAWIYDTAIGVKLGLFHNTKMTKNKIVLTVVVGGAHNFSRGKSLHFNIDGDIVSFKSVDLLTDISTDPGFVGSGLYVPPSNWSSKDYLVDRDFVERVINANKVVVKVDLRKSFVEGVFSNDFPTTARPAFREFLSRMKTLNVNR